MIVKELLVRLGVDFSEAGLKKAEDRLGSLKKAALGLAGTLAGSAAVAGLAHVVNETTKQADEMAKLAQGFGVNVEALQRLGHAAELSGVGVSNMRAALGQLVRNAGEAANGSEQARKRFADLGVSVTDAAGNLKGTDQLFMEVADAIAATPNPTKQAAMALELFGRDGARLVPLLKGGRKEIERTGAELDELGAVMSEQFSRDSEKFQDDLTRMGKAFLGIKIAITQAVLPAFNAIVNGITRGVAAVTRMLEGTEFLRVGFITLGAIATALAVKMVLPFLPYIAIAALVVTATLGVIAVLEDAWMSVTGGESVLARLVQRLMEFSTGNWVADGLLLPFKAFVKYTWEALRGIVALGAALFGNFEPLSKLWDEWREAAARAIDYVKNTLKSIPGVNLLFQTKEQSQAGALDFMRGLAMTPAITPGGGGGVNVTHAGNTIEVNVNGAGGDPAAIGQEVRSQIEAALDADREAAFSALVPVAGS